MKLLQRRLLSTLGLAVAATLAVLGLTVMPNAPAVANTAPVVNTVTEATPFVMPTAYGMPMMIKVDVVLDGPVNLSGQLVELWLDGESAGAGVLVYGMNGKFSTLAVATLPKAGAYTATVKFPGFVPTDPALPSATASESAPFTVNIAPQSTTTTITSAPSTADAFSLVNVAANVQASTNVPAGIVALMHDETEIARAQLQSSADPATGSSAQFTAAQLLPAGGTLWVQYLGSGDGNLAASRSAVQTIQVNPLKTRTTLALNTTVYRIDEHLTLDVTVANEAQMSQRAPSGSIEVNVDGVPVQTFHGVQAADLTSADGVGRFTVRLPAEKVGAGEHTVAANFIADPGFASSQTAPIGVTVQGLPVDPPDNTPPVDQYRVLAQTGHTAAQHSVIVGVVIAGVLGAALTLALRASRKQLGR